MDRMNLVVERYLKGENPTAIARAVNMRRADVMNYLDEWRGFAQNNHNINDRAREALVSADKHYSMIIERAWETVEQADDASELRTKAGALKLVADVEQKRIDMLQKAGVLDNTELAQQIVETERKQELLIAILKEVVSDCSRCNTEVKRRLQRVTGEAEPVVIVDHLTRENA